MASPSYSIRNELTERVDRNFSSLWGFVRPHRRGLVYGIVLLLLTNAFDKLFPWLLQHAIGSLKTGAFRQVKIFAVATIVCSIVMWSVRTASRIQIFNVGRDVEFEIRKVLLDKVHALGCVFSRKMTPGEIMSRATNDVAQVRL